MSSSCGFRLEAKDYWPHFQDAGALNAWVIDSDGDVERARSQAFQLRQGKYPSIELPEVIDEQHVQGMSSFLQAIGYSNHINAADAAGALKYDAWKMAKIGVTADYVRNAQSKARHQRKKLAQSRSYTYQCPKMIAKLGTAALDLTPECKARLEKLRNSPNDLNQWRLFHEEFGLFVCPIVTFGGAIYSSRSLERVGEGESDRQEGRKIASGEAVFQSGPWLYDLDMKLSAHSEEDLSQDSFSISRTATKAGLWVKFGGRDPLSNLQEWIEELKDVTTWRIIRRSKPIMLLDVIPDIPGMEWVTDCFQLPQHPIRPLTELAVPSLSRSPHPESQFAIETLDETKGNVTLLLFQNSLNHLVLVTLGILNSFAETPIVSSQVAPGTPLAIGLGRFKDSKIYVFFADEKYYLRDMVYSVQQGRWSKGHLQQSKIKVHQDSALLSLGLRVYFQDSKGDILSIEMREDEETNEDKWEGPFNLHTKESFPLQKACIGTPISGKFTKYCDTQGFHERVVLYYLSSQGRLVRGIDGFSQQYHDQGIPGVENPQASAWQESPWANSQQEGALCSDFSMAPDHPERATPPIVFRTAGGFLNMCWQSKENESRWVEHLRICQTLPGSHFRLHFSCLHSCYETAYIFFLSQAGKLEMIEIDPHVSEDTPYISQRTIVDEICGTKPWKRLIVDTGDSSSDCSSRSDLTEVG